MLLRSLLRAEAEVPSHAVMLLHNPGHISFPLVASECESPVNTPSARGLVLKSRGRQRRKAEDDRRKEEAGEGGRKQEK